MAVNKVVYDGKTLVDLTGDSVTPETLAEGATAHDASGKQIIGALSIAPLAYEIREKTGLDDANTLEQLAIDAASLPGRLFDVPDYVRNEAARVAAVVKSLQNENTLSFIAVTDPHVTTSTQGIASALHAAQGAKIISDLVPIDFAALLGDVVSGANGETSEKHISNLMASLRATAVFDPILRLSGNHDANIYSAEAYQTAADVYRYTGRFTRAVKPTSEQERNYFYFDVANKQTRIICLNTADLKGMPSIGSSGNEGNSDGHNISAAQFEWLISALDMTDKTGWRVIVLSHHPLHWYGSMENALKILEAYVGGKAGSISVAGGYGSGDPSTTVSYNFAGKNAAKLIATIHGHTHNLIHGKVGNYEIIRMGTPNACYGRNNEYGNSGGDDFRAKYGETTTYPKTANSAKDTAFIVYTVDFEKEVISATCYGAGYDRVMSFADVAYYTIANNLSNATSSNNTAIIAGGASYTATITADSGYELSSVTITMGGVDITSSAYSGGVVTIAEVTGNVVITAATIKLPTSYVVDIATVGYTENARWSASDGTIRTGATGHVAINKITFDRPAGTTLTVTLGGGVNWSYGGNCVIARYRDDEFVGAAYLNANSNDSNAGYSKTMNGDGSVVLTFFDPAQSAYEGTNGFKVSGYGTGADAVITIEGGSSGGSTGSVENVDIASIGYNDGYRWSSSTGSLTEANGYTAINAIPFDRDDGQTVVFTLSGISWAHSTRCTFVLCKADGTRVAGEYLNDDISSTNVGYAVTHNADGTATMEIFDNGQSAYDGICAVKFAGYGSGADAKITIGYK